MQAAEPVPEAALAMAAVMILRVPQAEKLNPSLGVAATRRQRDGLSSTLLRYSRYGIRWLHHRGYWIARSSRAMTPISARMIRGGDWAAKTAPILRARRAFVTKNLSIRSNCVETVRSAPQGSQRSRSGHVCEDSNYCGAWSCVVCIAVKFRTRNRYDVVKMHRLRKKQSRDRNEHHALAERIFYI
jgi:hypothetical protein